MKNTEQTVLITGASRGIGLALAEAFAKRKCRLHLVARTTKAEIGEKLLSLGAESVQQYSVDLSSSDNISEFCKSFDRDIDILVNNAGLLTGGLLEKQDFSEIQKMLAVNINAVIQLTNYFLPKMVTRRKGKIINNASVSGKMFLPCASTYAASKAAVVGFTESLKQELGGTGVSTLLLVTPGVNTDMYDDISNRYGDHLELDMLSSISAEEWAEKVMSAIEADKETLWPKGMTRFGVWLGQHMPGVLEKAVSGKFSR